VRELINRDYTRLWYGQAVSTTGDYVFDTTLALWVATDLGKGHSWAPAAMSGVLLAAGAAVLVVGPLAGVFVDRWNRKRVMLHTEVVRAVLVALLAGLAVVPEDALPLGAWLGIIYVTVFAVNAASQFFNPARLAILGEIVPGDADRARASGIEQATSATAAIIGPPLAAPLLFTIGVQWALAFNALSYVASYVAIRSVRVARDRGNSLSPSTRNFRGEFTAGLRYFAKSRFLVTVLVMAVIAQLGTGALNALNIFFLTSNLHAPAKLYGLLSTALGVGAVIGGLASGRVVRQVGARSLIWLGAAATGVLVLIYARQTDFGVALALVVMAVRVSRPGFGGVQSSQHACLDAIHGRSRLAGQQRDARLARDIDRYPPRPGGYHLQRLRPADDRGRRLRHARAAPRYPRRACGGHSRARLTT
jgi:MFS family permease